MIEPGNVIVFAGLTASLLSPACPIYCAIKVCRDFFGMSWPMLILGALAVVQAVAATIYFAMLWHDMDRTGLGV